MLRVAQRSSGALLVLSVLLFLPSAAYAQAAITGVAKDASGAVLPGVTVEAASPVLIEKVRSVVTDGTGQYRIVDLRPGTYSVTFSLPGFSTVKREGIELSGTFIATVNGDMKVGALEETITVTGETPIVDVQSAKVQQTVSKDIIAAIPSSRNAGGIQALVPGMSGGGDNGGISGGQTGGAGAIHGGRGNDSRTQSDGNNTGWAGGSAGGGNTPNVAGAQEVVLSTSGGLGEAETSGVILNVIPRDGGNTFGGQVFFSGANGALQGSNYTQELKDRGLATPQELKKVYDINPMGGGRIIRDKLWFYLTYRQTGAENTVPGMWFNKNAGNPNSWVVDFDKSRPAFNDSLNRTGIGRITWQITPKNKFSMHWSEMYNNSSIKGGGGATTTPEADGRTLYQPSRIPSATWSAPVTGRLLLEAGWGAYQARYRNPTPRVDGSHNPRMIRLQEQGGDIPNLSSRMPYGTNGGFNHHLIGTIAALRASISYVTGAHNMKFGYQGGFSNPSQTYTYFNEIIHVRTNGGVPNRLTQVIVAPNSTDPLGNFPNVKYVRNLLPLGLFAQDQWTTGRLTLQGGLRYDHMITTYPTSSVGGPGYTAAAAKEILFPARSTPGIKWDDVTPRMGVAYDLFGNGKTALKFNFGKYMEAFVANNSDFDLNPLIRTAVSTTRVWTDSNKDFVANCDLSNPNKNGECADMADKNLGKEVFNRSYDLGLIHGYGNRPYNWSIGVSVQQEIMPRVSATVGFFRNWWGNWYAVDNRSTSPADYTPFSITAPVDARLPGGGGQVISGLYNLIPTKVGQVDELAQHLSNFGQATENWQGVDVNIVARLRSGLTVQGGTSTGRKLSDVCAIKAALPEYGTGPQGSNNSITAGSPVNPYCRNVEPYRSDFKGLATYTIPRIDVQVSGTWRSNPGDDLAANFVVNNTTANAGPLPLGRNLSDGNVTVNLLKPNTLFAERQNVVDFRIAKIFRYGRTRSQVGVDIYNAMNNDFATSQTQTFSTTSTAWLRPTAIIPARYARISAQFDF
ncbi:MAG TPA: carboxypeptidase regulatory-like domain-containing protein [Vicinamibacterales bacterium]